MKNNIQKTFAAFFAIAFIGLFSAVASAAPENDNFADATEIGLNGFPYTAFFTETNVGATKETGEPNLFGNLGGKSVWYKWTAPSSRTVQINLGRSDFNLNVGVYTGSAVNALTQVTADQHYPALPNAHGFVTVNPVAGTTYYIMVDGYRDAIGQVAEGSINLTLSSALVRNSADFDRDGLTDIGVYRPSENIWYIRNSSNGEMRAAQWGLPGDVPVTTGDFSIQYSGWSDYVTFRPSEGMFYIFENNNAEQYKYFRFGLAGDIPVTGDFIGNNSPDVGVFRPSTGVWYFQNTSFRYVTDAVQFGQAGDIPMPGDYDFDEKTDIAVFRPSTGDWYIKSSQNGVQAIHWGTQGDIPVRGDFDGDGRNDLVVYRPSEGKWYVLLSSNGQTRIAYWGLNGDIPISGDFDGDGRFDYALFRPSDRVWYIKSSGFGAIYYYYWGLTGDIPVAGNFAN